MEDHDLLYLSRSDVERAGVAMDEIRDALERVYAEKGRGLVESPPKRGIVPRPDSTIRAMKAFVPSLGAAGVKWIGAYPGNVAAGLPTITGLIVLNDVETGIPKAVMDCTWITAMRSAASTAIAAKHLARKDSESVGLVACGLQARANLAALCRDYPVRKVTAYDLVPSRAAAFALEMSPLLGVDIEPAKDVADAVAGADIVVTSAPIQKDPRPPVGPGRLKEGAFACLLDFDSTFGPAALREADVLVTDDVAQVSFFREIGWFRGAPEPDADLGKIVAGRLRGRESERQRIISLNLGVGFLDIVTASLVHRRAAAKGLGTPLPLELEPLAFDLAAVLEPV